MEGGTGICKCSAPPGSQLVGIAFNDSTSTACTTYAQSLCIISSDIFAGPGLYHSQKLMEILISLRIKWCSFQRKEKNTENRKQKTENRKQKQKHKQNKKIQQQNQKTKQNKIKQQQQQQQQQQTNKKTKKSCKNISLTMERLLTKNKWTSAFKLP